MEIKKILQIKTNDYVVVLLARGDESYEQYCQSPGAFEYVRRELSSDTKFAQLNDFKRLIFFVTVNDDNRDFREKERLRDIACDIHKQLAVSGAERVVVTSVSVPRETVLAFGEGLALSAYRFDKYKSEKPKKVQLSQVCFFHDDIRDLHVEQLTNVVKGVFIARDLINEPYSTLHAPELSSRIRKYGEEAGFETEIFFKEKIVEMKMGGLLAVNKGSAHPPTFNILEYLPENPVNGQPFVLVGKGVVFDTGGLNIKHPYDFMLDMKCDMSGAAAVVGAIYALAKNKIPVHVIGLIPATDNMIDPKAMIPGDVLTMMSGKTVEVHNTDAEGRLILADALHYAKRLKPELVIDIATLTGSAQRAIGKYGIVYMAKSNVRYKNDLENSGREVYERLVEFPLWEEYGKELESTVADIKNIGSAEGGAITAGKFLEHFTDYDWIHLDIAGPAFLHSPSSYRGIGGTGVGVRLFYEFLCSQVEETGRKHH
jgi:leucyl aminopeptidase